MLVDSYKYIYTFTTPSNDSPPIITNETYDLLLTIDAILKADFVTPTIQGIDMLSKTLIYEETTKLDGLLIHTK